MLTFRTLFIIILMSLPMHVFSQQVAASKGLVFQIIQDEFVLDEKTVKNAILAEENGNYRGLNIELKQPVAAYFTKMIKNGMGNRINLVFNNKILTSSVIQNEISSNFLISDISKEDAQTFLNWLSSKVGGSKKS